MTKKRIIKTVSDRLEKYYYHPPYGSRYWILMPYMEDNTKLSNQIKKDFDIEELNIRPMYQNDF